MVGVSVQRNCCWPTGCIVLTLFVLAGCGDGRPGSATVEGKVTINGQPASSGRVFFRSADGKYAVVATIGPDGTYRAVDLPCEAMKVTVVPPTKWERIGLIRDAKKGKKSSASDAPAKPGGADAFEPTVKIPEKYQDPDASGLTLTIKRGANVYNIEISSE